MAELERAGPRPLFRFDKDVLQEAENAIPTDLQLLRLRLRFGVPGQVYVGQRFRVAVDLVDEMGQAVPGSLGLPEGLDIHLACSDRESSLLDHQLVLMMEETLASARSKQRTKWVYYATLASPRGSSLPPSGTRVALMIQMEQSLQELSETQDLRHALQDFCVGSAWLNGQTLVLPLQVNLQITRTSGEADKVATSTACERLFRPQPSVENHRSSLIVIEESYGDAMGSHVWDASILLSFLVQRAGITELTSPEEGGTSTILELGSGCGLFANVLASRQSTNTGVATIFTEKAECTERLQANLDRNGSPPSALVLPLEWGAPLPSALGDADVQVVFAADVLYNWVAHEAFLATLDALAREQDPPTTREVFLAHKRRGRASAANLRALASGAVDPAREAGCRWRHWRVQKLSSLGRVDLFRLTVIKR